MSNDSSSSFFRPWHVEDEENDVQTTVPIASEERSVSSCSSHYSDNSTESNAYLFNTSSTTPYAYTSAAAAEWGAARYYPEPPVCYPQSALMYCPVQEAVARINQQDQAAKQAKKSRPKKYKCDYCDVAFSNNGQLKGHVRIHTGERPFKCDHDGCGKDFTRNEELTRHKRIHTGEKPYKCSDCQKAFGRKDHLKKHKNTHRNRQLYGHSYPIIPTIGNYPFDFQAIPVARYPFSYI